MHVTRQEQPRLLSVQEAAKLLGISERMAWKLVASGEINSIRLGGRRMIARAEVDRLERLAQRGGQP